MKKYILIFVTFLIATSCSNNMEEINDFEIQVNHVVRGDTSGMDTTIINNTTVNERNRLN